MYKVEIFELVVKRTRKVETKESATLDDVTALLKAYTGKNIKVVITNMDLPKQARKGKAVDVQLPKELEF